MIKSIITNAENDIKEIQKTATQKILERQATALECTVELFSSVGWNNWSKEQLVSAGQYERCIRGLEGKKMKIMSISEDKRSGTVMGSAEYTISPKGCSCGDFIQRRLPCKHMYFFAINEVDTNE